MEVFVDENPEVSWCKFVVMLVVKMKVLMMLMMRNNLIFNGERLPI